MGFAASRTTKDLQMVHRVASCAVDDFTVHGVLAVVDGDGPDVDECEEGNVGELVEREQKGEDVVGQTLGEAVERVERVRGKRRRHDPLVVRLVQLLVERLVVQRAVDPVDEEVGEGDEDRELRVIVPLARSVGGPVVHLRVAAHLCHEKGGGEDGHDGQGAERRGDLEADLVLDVLGVLEVCGVEDEEVGERGEGEVD